MSEASQDTSVPYKFSLKSDFICEAFNYKLYRMTHFVNSQHLPRAIYVIDQWTYEQRGHGGRDGSYA